MAKKSELWIATAAGELTSVISLDRDESLATLRIILKGNANSSNGYITYIIMSSIDSLSFDTSEIDARGVNFFVGDRVNEHAVECLLRVIGCLVKNGRDAFISVSGRAVRETLEGAFRALYFPPHPATIQWKSASFDDVQNLRLISARQ